MEEHQLTVKAPPPALLEDAKGGELVLKLVVVWQALVESARRDEGQTMAEYGVVLGVITILVVTAIAFLSGQIISALESVAGLL